MTEERMLKLDGIGFRWPGRKCPPTPTDGSYEEDPSSGDASAPPTEATRKTRRAATQARYRQRRRERLDAIQGDLTVLLDQAIEIGGPLKAMVEAKDVYKHASPIPLYLIEDGIIKPTIDISEEAKERIREELDIDFSPKMKHCVYASDEFEVACRVCLTKWNSKTFFVYFLDTSSCEKIKNVGLANDKCNPARACDEGKWKLDKACPIIKVVQVTLGSEDGMSDFDGKIELIRDERNMALDPSIDLKYREDGEMPSLPPIHEVTEDVMDEEEGDGEDGDGLVDGEDGNGEQVEEVLDGDTTMYDAAQFVAV
ncbi:hypothetical protein ACHAWF_012609 [Thalassiosira exigua]